MNQNRFRVRTQSFNFPTELPQSTKAAAPFSPIRKLKRMTPKQESVGLKLRNGAITQIGRQNTLMSELIRDRLDLSSILFERSIMNMEKRIVEIDIKKGQFKYLRDFYGSSKTSTNITSKKFKI